MALEWIFMDNFEWIATGGSGSSARIFQRYLRNNEADIFFNNADTVTSARSVLFDSSTNAPALFLTNTGGNIRSIHCGFWYKNVINTSTAESRSNADAIWGTYNSDGVRGVSLGLTFPGAMVVYVGSTIWARTPVLFLDNVWNYVELFVDFATSGRFKLAVNGVEMFNLTGDTNPFVARGKLESIYWQGYNTSSGNQARLENAWARFSTGSETAPTFYGPMKVVATVPDADGNYTAWSTTSAASPPVYYTEVDELGDPDSTTYVSTNTSAAKATFGHGALGLDTGDVIKCLSIAQSVLKTSDGGGGAMRAMCRISSTDYFLMERFPDDASQWTISQWVWEDSPATASAWTEAEVDGAEFGLEYVG